MGIYSPPQINGNESIDDLRNIVAVLVKDLEFLVNGNIDSKNAREIGGWRVSRDKLMSKDGDVGMSTNDAGADPVRFWSGGVDITGATFRVHQSGKLYATNAFITGRIEGSTIIGSEIKTSETLYPRVTISSSSHLISAESSAADSIKILADDAGQPALHFDNTFVQGIINANAIANALFISTVIGKGKIQISSGGQLDLFAGSGADVYVNAWNRFRNQSTGRSLQQDLDAVTPTITPGTYSVVTFNSAGAPSSGRDLIATDMPSGIPQSNITGLTVDLASKANKTQEAVRNPVFSGTWTNFGGLYTPVGYFKDEFGIVHLFGSAKDGAIGSAIFVLDADCRPSTVKLFGTASNDSFGEVQILSNGEVKAATGSNVQYSLDGITFKAGA